MGYEVAAAPAPFSGTSLIQMLKMAEAIDIKTGVIIDKGDVEAMAEEIIKMKNSPLSSNDCRDRALRFFDKNECFKAYVLLFKKILSERNLL